MKKLIRSFVLMPLLALLLVAIPAVFFSFVGGTPSAVGQTVPPPTGTVPPTPRPTARPRPLPAPTPVPPRVPDLRVRAGGYLLEKVIGDRQSATLYGVAFNGRLFRSDNDGNTWALVTSRPRFTTFLMSPADPDVLYAADPLACEEGIAGGGFFRSDDGGVTWEDTEPGLALYPLLVNRADSAVVLAAACDGLYQSADGGASWSPVATSETDPVWKGLIAAKAWAAYFAGNPNDTPSWDVLYVVAEGLDGGDVILNSIDGGARWMVITPVADDITFAISSLSGDPTSDLRIWFADEEGVWSTEDGGNLWGLSSQGLANALARGLRDVEHHPNEILLLGTGRGLYSKATDETQWQQLGTGVFLRLNINDLLFTDSRDSRIWLNTATGVYIYTLR